MKFITLPGTFSDNMCLSYVNQMLGFEIIPAKETNNNDYLYQKTACKHQQSIYASIVIVNKNFLQKLKCCKKLIFFK